MNWEDNEPGEADELMRGTEGRAWTKRVCMAHVKT